MATDQFTNPAHALHDVIERVRQLGSRSVRDAWSGVLGSGLDTRAGARRHAEVVGLYGMLLDDLDALPADHRARQRANGYLSRWYKAVVWTDNWDSPAGGIIKNSDLDQLAATGDILEGRYAQGATSGIPRLQVELDNLSDLLDETPELSNSLREKIRSQLEHVRWLLEHVAMFGPGPAIRESQQLTGQVTETVLVRLGKSAMKNRWVRGLGSLVFAVTLFSQGLEEAGNAIESARNTIEVVVDMKDDLFSIFSDTPQLESGTDADVLEGEVLDDTTEPGPTD